jgi:hypothetical protein
VPYLITLTGFSDSPRILIFVASEVIYAPILRLYFEVQIIRFPPGLEDGGDLDLALVYEK